MFMYVGFTILLDIGHGNFRPLILFIYHTGKNNSLILIQSRRLFSELLAYHVSCLSYQQMLRSLL
jgi:hypothetical protein